MTGLRSDLKRTLARVTSDRPAAGLTMLIYHRIGGPGIDELDMAPADFTQQMRVMADQPVVSLDDGLAALGHGDSSSRFVLTFDDGFADVYTHAWPLLREMRLPFTIYLATAYVGGRMRWEGSTAKDCGGPALSWLQLEEMVASGLCTVGNHTHTHARPEMLDERELDTCNQLLEERLGITRYHFAYPWGVPVPRLEHAMRGRFHSAATGYLGRNLPGVDAMRLARVPVRRSDPVEFFMAKLVGGLLPERLYGGIVRAAKSVGAHA